MPSDYLIDFAALIGGRLSKYLWGIGKFQPAPVCPKNTPNDPPTRQMRYAECLLR
jgi:hypothetical protein